MVHLLLFCGLEQSIYCKGRELRVKFSCGAGAKGLESTVIEDKNIAMKNTGLNK